MSEFARRIHEASVKVWRHYKHAWLVIPSLFIHTQQDVLPNARCVAHLPVDLIQHVLRHSMLFHVMQEKLLPLLARSGAKLDKIVQKKKIRNPNATGRLGSSLTSNRLQ